ncbi:hypothetical protein [Pseudarthrobacter sulfonivorans]|uniref:hypothetical protein n=1 Tax=Pseudarthrobacter sulfonivorans TaxID=121292 RepID=UPI0027D79F00|nr:hypothetical protein [Pseudarthrobacter sulfonivorans]
MIPTSDTMEHLGFVCTSILNEHGGDARPWLDARWNLLNQSRPVVQFSYVLSAESSRREHPNIDADLSLMTHVDHELYWGVVNNRQEVFSSIMNGLLEGFHKDSYEQWFQTMGRIKLCEIPGIYGHLYRVAGDTRHRVHTLMALGLGAFPAEVTGMEQSRIIDLTFHTGKGRGIPSFKRLTEGDVPSQMARALVHSGYLEKLDATRYKVLQELPGPWLFSYTWENIASASKRYQVSYPQYGATPLERMSLDATQAKRFVKEYRK